MHRDNTFLPVELPGTFGAAAVREEKNGKFQDGRNGV
jgi:hypothetical protein